MRILAKFIFKITGWSIQGAIPAGVNQCVLIMAPHTSNWDFFIGRLAYWILRVEPKILIKKEAFKYPFKPLLKIAGGIPVDRSKNNNLVDFAADLFTQNDQLVITITPEGTRSRVNTWKKGFYFIANKAQVPIVMGFLDYKKKVAGIGPAFNTTGDIHADFDHILEFYKDINPCHPEKYNPQPRINGSTKPRNI